MSQRIKQFILLGLTALSIFSTTVNAEGIKIKSFELEKVDSDWVLSAAFQIELSPGLEEAVQKGVVSNGLLILVGAFFVLFAQRPHVLLGCVPLIGFVDPLYNRV